MSITLPTIGILDGSPALVASLAEVLADEGFAVVDGAAAPARADNVAVIAWLEDHRPQVVIYDIGPPYVANWQAFKELQAHPAARRTRFVLLTTSPYLLADLAGATSDVTIVAKPFTVAHLLQALATSADRGERW